ncbi:hypothetical protein TRFO_13458 [Tritrichomonas foetus]|uniref:Uncharacterized protein n=1 Tax=Tritrichomonas foetus TaxID=1144522 RepID=A0A1J4KY88_9EUKA|nr:hypothetical protein TRFO_13458 [Tritrichomonas foetus]|eukprot:OHT16130.1 hypothetical protein TRFO_13458 [Tritrichomonas foetus]
MWFKKAKIANSLTRQLTENPDLPIKEVLENPDLLQSIRNEAQELLDYFTQKEEHLKELFDLALSDRLNDESIDFRYNRNASNVLSSVAKTFQKAVESSQIAINALNDFIKDENKKYNRNPVYSGHFQRIIQSHLFATFGKFIDLIPDLKNFLIKNVDILGYKQLLVSLLVDFHECLNDPGIGLEIAKIVTSAPKEEVKLHAIQVFIDVMRDRPDCTFLFQQEIFEKLLLFAASFGEANLLYYEIFNALKMISRDHEDTGWLYQIKHKFVNQFPFKDQPEEVAYVAFPFFASFALEKMLKSFFKDDAPTSFTLAVLEQIKKVPDEKLHDMIKVDDIINKIMESGLAFPSDENYHVRINSHIFKFGMFLIEKDLPPHIVDKPGWDLFICTKLLHREHLIKQCTGVVEKPESHVSDFF